MNIHDDALLFRKDSNLAKEADSLFQKTKLQKKQFIYTVSFNGKYAKPVYFVYWLFSINSNTAAAAFHLKQWDKNMRTQIWTNWMQWTLISGESTSKYTDTV